MPFRAAFSQVDITPQPGVAKAGFKKLTIAETVLDPLYARIAILESENTRMPGDNAMAS